MRVVDAATTNAWKSEVKAGPTRPYVRATSQRVYLGRYPYNTEDAPGHDYDHHRARTGFYRSALFGHGGAPREIPNIRRCEWNRSVDQDVATCTLTIQNTQLIPIGSAMANGQDFEMPGSLGFSRGDPANPEPGLRWGYTDRTPYTGFLRPDRLVRTYEGYGSDPTVAPGDDPHLYISGTWLVDEVNYDANGDLVMTMRDLGRLLLDHMCFPPIVPYADYPLEWSRIATGDIDDHVPHGGNWGKPPATATSSNGYYWGRNINDTPPYVTASGSVQGHGNHDPLSTNVKDYWLSTGQVDRDSFVWWQEDLTHPRTLAGIRVRTLGGPYKVYVSLWDGTKWVGRRSIPYSHDGLPGSWDEPSTGEVSGVDISAHIPFVDSDTIPDGSQHAIVFRRVYTGITKIRLTFTHLREMAAVNYPFRAGLRDVELYTGAGSTVTKTSRSKGTGNYSDFTDIIRWVCAWSGFYWPPNGADNWQRFRDTFNPADRTHYVYATSDPSLVSGRVWGSLQETGTGGVVDLTADQFDKQPLMTVIQKVREIVGYQFMVDEAGGVVWRQPNIYRKGNYVTRDHKSTRLVPARTDDYVTIDENETLMQYSTRLSSRNLRERIFVGDTNGRFGAVVRGYTPLMKTGFRRTAGWLDNHWKNRTRAIVAGEMIAARQMFDYRRAKATVWGNPAIQIDDQIRYYERVTNETYFHYVLGISSVLDMEAGTWNYDIESHWLGPDREDGDLIADGLLLSTPTRNYLHAIGVEH